MAQHAQPRYVLQVFGSMIWRNLAKMAPTIKKRRTPRYKRYFAKERYLACAILAASISELVPVADDELGTEPKTGQVPNQCTKHLLNQHCKHARDAIQRVSTPHAAHSHGLLRNIPVDGCSSMGLVLKAIVSAAASSACAELQSAQHSTIAAGIRTNTPKSSATRSGTAYLLGSDGGRRRSSHVWLGLLWLRRIDK